MGGTSGGGFLITRNQGVWPLHADPPQTPPGGHVIYKNHFQACKAALVRSNRALWSARFAAMELKDVGLDADIDALQRELDRLRQSLNVAELSFARKQRADK